MRATVAQIDPAIKRSLLGLAAAVIVVVVLVVRALCQEFGVDRSPTAATPGPPRLPNERREIPDSPPPSAASASAGSWTRATAGASAEGTVLSKEEQVVARQRAQQQASYLRKAMAQAHPPEGLGHLSPKEIDEMEKKGILIW